MKQLKIALALFGLLWVLILNGCSSGGGSGGAGSVGSSLDASTLNVKLLNPLPGATKVSPSLNVQIVFSKAVAGVNSQTIVLHEDSAAGPIVSIGEIVKGSNNIYTFSPSKKLKANAAACLVLGAVTGANVGAEAGTQNVITSLEATNDKLSETTFCFTTGDDSAPTVVPVVPSDGETGVSTNPNIQVKFSEEVIKVNAANVTVHEGSPTGKTMALSDITSGANNTFTFSPTATLNQNTSYYVVLGSGITDLTDEHLAQYGFSFTTGDFGSPVASMISPSNNATAVSVSPGIQLQFSKEVTSVNANNVTLHEGSPTGKTITLSDITAGSNNTFTFSPTTKLNQQTTYYIVLGAGIKDMMGHNLAETDFSFTTGDFKAPTVSIISPSNNATGISTSPTIQLQFSEAVSNVNPINVTLHEGSPTGTPVLVGSLTAGANNTFTVSPGTVLNQQTTYYVVVGAGVTDVAGNPLVIANFSFTTGDFTSPTANIISPSNNATGVSVSPGIQLKFSKSVINVNSANVTLRMGSSTGTIIPISEVISGADNTFTFSPGTPPLNQQTTYYVVLGAGITDIAGNPLAVTNFSFTTGDFKAPTVSIISPSNNATGISVSPSIQIKFSEAVVDVTAANITLHEDSPTGPTISIGSVIPGDDNTFTFSASAPLNQQTTYYVVLGAGITDIAGNPLAVTNFSFTTGDFTAPTVNMISPGNNATGISLSPSIQLKFSEAVNNVTASNVTLRQGRPDGPIVSIGSVTPSADNTFTFSPDTALNQQTTYYVVLSSAITDIRGNHLSATSFSFTTVVLNITSFSLGDTPGVISGRNIVVTLPFGTPVKNLVATFTTSAGTSLTVKGIPQVYGETQNDFTSPVTYTVYSDGSSTQNYTVKVILAAYTYVTNMGSSSVSMYILDTATGILQNNRVDTPTGGSPSGIAVDPAGHYAYVANADSGTVSMYSINSKTGALTALGTISTDAGPQGIVIDPSGHYVYVTNGRKSTISMYSIDSGTGLLTALGTVIGGTNAYSIAVDPSGRYVYSPGSGNGVTFMYGLNSSSGSLVSLGSRASGGSPSVIAIEPTGHYAYVTNGNMVQIFTINSSNGNLSYTQYAYAGSGAVGIAIDPSGRYAYVTNSGGSSVSMYRINSSTGALTDIGTIGAGAAPYAIKVDPTGRYVYVGNYATNTMSMYSINSDGTLKSLSPATVTTLGNSWGIAIVYPAIAP